MSDASERHVLFIGGTGRCGTTMLRRVVATSHAVSALRQELHVHTRCGFFEAALRGRAMTDEEIDVAMKRLHPRKAPFRKALVAARDAFVATGSIQGAADRMFDVAFRWRGLFVEDSPDNMLQVQMLARVWPNAKFVHMIRHPLVVLESTQQMPWGKSSYPETARWLAERYDRMLNAEGEVDKSRLLRLRLEDLVKHRKRHLRVLGDWVGIDVVGSFSMIDGETSRRRKISSDARSCVDILSPFIKEFGYS